MRGKRQFDFWTKEAGTPVTIFADEMLAGKPGVISFWTKTDRDSPPRMVAFLALQPGERVIESGHVIPTEDAPYEARQDAVAHA